MVMSDHRCPSWLKSKVLLERQSRTVKDHHLKSREETAAFKKKHGVDTTPQTFIDGKRSGGYDDLREHFGQNVRDENEASYQPVVAIFATALLMALAVSWYTFGAVVTVDRKSTRLNSSH